MGKQDRLSEPTLFLDNMKKIITFILGKAKYIIAGIAAFSIVALGCLSGHYHNRVRESETQISTLQQSIIEQNELITKLAAMESVHCEVHLTVKNTAVMGSAHAGSVNQDAQQIATYLRGEILDKLIEEQSTNTK